MFPAKCKAILKQPNGEILEYALVGEEGPDHNKTFTFAVKLNGEVIGLGTGRSKKEAEQAAAKTALEQMNG